MYADRYSGWTEVVRLKDGTFRSVEKNFLTWFATHGVPDEISSDGGPPFSSSDYSELLKSWKISPRLSSAYYPQSNGRAEVAVKTIKRILRGNVDSLTGDVNTRRATCALMLHRNTPHQDSGLSPAEMIYGHRIRDHLPDMFRSTEAKRTGSKKVNLPKSEISEQRRTLKPLKLGDSVSVQNQSGNRPKKWDRTGRIVEAMPHRQYRVALDGSKHVTLRNRRFLRRIAPSSRKSNHQQRFSSLRPKRRALQTPQPAKHTSRAVSRHTTPSPRPPPSADNPATPETPMPATPIMLGTPVSQESQPRTPTTVVAQPPNLVSPPLPSPTVEPPARKCYPTRIRTAPKRLIAEM